MRIAIVLIVFLSGCLVNTQAPDPAGVEITVTNSAEQYLSQDHGGEPARHFDAALHASSLNLDRIGYSNGWDNTGDPNTIPDGVYYTEFAIHNDMVLLARGTATSPPDQGGLDDAMGGFVVIDASNVRSPRVIGEYDAPLGADIEIDADGYTAFFATQRNTVEEVAGTVQETREPQSGAPRGIHIVDIRDPEQPELINFVPFGYNGPHTVDYHNDGNREFLFVQTYDFYANTAPSGAAGPANGGLGGIPGGVSPATQRVTAYEIQRGNDNVALAQIGHFQVVDPDTDKLVFPHDVHVEKHPINGKTYLYVSYWDAGIQIIDISDLPAPGATESPIFEAVGSYAQFDPSSRNNIHFAKPMDTLIDDRHITVTEPEIITADETGYITFVDTTTPGRPEKACTSSYWTLPGGLFTSILEFSPHNFDTFDQKVALAHNHAGLWIIDASDLCKPRSVGYTMDVMERQDSPKMQPYFWGVLEHNGYLFASDEGSGLYIFEYTGP